MSLAPIMIFVANAGRAAGTTRPARGRLDGVLDDLMAAAAATVVSG